MTIDHSPQPEKRLGRGMHASEGGIRPGREAGGMKLIGGLHDSTVRDTVSAYNNGDGIWIDWKNTCDLIENNTTAYNGATPAT